MNFFCGMHEFEFRKLGGNEKTLTVLNFQDYANFPPVLAVLNKNSMRMIENERK